jgi:hypothetical protein
MLIDVAISGDRNVIKKEAEKVLKYKDLTIEIIVCLRNMSINTLHKGDDDDDDNKLF